MPRTWSRLAVLGIAVALAEIIATSSALAHRWTVCNRTPDDVEVAIAYSNGSNYTSEGWWTLRRCGGCATVLNKNLPAVGVFLRGEAVGGSAVFEGDTIHCTRNNAFTLRNSSVSTASCRSRGGVARQFQMVTLRSGKHTTNLNGKSSSGRVCID